jgi:flavin-dependent dehydrogenase
MVSSSTQHSGSIGNVSQRGIPDEVDVAIVGSGGAGLMAALSAVKEGARVLVVESRRSSGARPGSLRVPPGSPTMASRPRT